MRLFLLRAVRRLLRRVDARIAPRRFPVGPIGSPPDRAREKEFADFLLSLDLDASARSYLETHLERMARTLALSPPPGATGCALELGSYVQMAPALQLKLGYREIIGAYFGPASAAEVKTATAGGREVFRCRIDLFDAEHDAFPYPDGRFDLALACEIIEHLERDPMHMLLEIRRVLAAQGALLITTPNCASVSSVARVLEGRLNPQVFSRYPRPEREEARGVHVREYTPWELAEALRAAGFRIETLFTDRPGGHVEAAWALDFLVRHGYDTTLRGEQIYCLARKQEAASIDRYPSFLYAG